MRARRLWRGGGAVLAGLILGTVAVFIIDRQFERAALFAVAGGVLSYFGFIHGAALGIGSSTPVAIGYLIMAGICLALGRQSLPEAIGSIEPEPATAEGED